MSSYPSSASLVVTQTRYQLLYFIRVPVALFFTLLLPLIMLVMFNLLFGDNSVDTPDGAWPIRQFYTGGIAAYTAVSATYSNLANMVPVRRDEGVLKRWRGTPLPTWICIAGFVISAVIIAVVGAVITLLAGVLFYGLEIETAKLPAAIVTFLVGVAAFAALGMAIAALIPSAAAAPAVANATILPLAFVSDVFVSVDPDSLLAKVADLFPLKPFVNAFQDCFNPFVDAPAFNWPKLGVLALWGIGGALVAVKKFSWEPKASGGRRRSSRRGGTEPAASQ